MEFFISGIAESLTNLFFDKFGRLSHDIKMDKEDFIKNIDQILKSKFIDEIMIDNEIDGKKYYFSLKNNSKVYHNENLWTNIKDTRFCYKYFKHKRIITKY